MANVLDACTVLVFSCHGAPSKAKISNDNVKTDIDAEWLHTSVDIFKSPELDKIRTCDGAMRNWLRYMQVPGAEKVMGGGRYLVSVNHIDKIEDKLDEYAKDREAAIDAFGKAYPELVKQAKAKLKSGFDEKHYPSFSVVRKRFRFEFSYQSFGVDNKIESISKKLWQREKEKAEQFWKNAGEEFTTAMRVGLLELTSKLADVLTPGDDGAKKRFHKNHVENIIEWLDLFEGRNVMGDEELAKVAGECKTLIHKYEMGAIRKDADVRTALVENFGRINKNLEELVDTAPKRKIEVD